MGRPPCGDKVAVKKGPWTPEEDIILISYVQKHGPRNWPSVAINTGLMRCSKSCRLRWTNYLRPGIRRGNFTPHEEGIIVRLQSLLGNRWAAIASYLPQRTDNDIKNHWNTHLKKKLSKQQAIGAIFAPPPPSEPASIIPTAASHVDCHHHGDSSSSSYASSMGNISKLLHGFLKCSPAQDDATNIKPSSVTGINPLLSFDHMSGGGALPPISDVPPQQQHQEVEFTGHGGYHDPNNWLFDEAAEHVVDQLMEISDGRCSVPMLL